MSSIQNITNEVEINKDESPSAGGGFSEVYRGRYYNQDKVVAIKKLIIKNFKAKSATEAALRLKKRMDREVRVWKQLDHPNIVRLLGVYTWETDGFPCMVMPWYQHGNASTNLRERKLSISDKFTLLYEIACGLEYLHTRSPPIVHGDLKAQNVLIDDGGCALLCDFGISRIVEEVLEPTGTTTSGVMEGTVRWSAPEVILGEERTRFIPASDVWSFGCTGYEIFAERIPYYEYRARNLVVIKIGNGEIPTWPKGVRRDNGCKDISHFITNFIWKRNPEERRETNEIVKVMHSMTLRLNGKGNRTDEEHDETINPKQCSHWHTVGIVVSADADSGSGRKQSRQLKKKLAQDKVFAISAFPDFLITYLFFLDSLRCTATVD